jgi:hypothetical protein
LSKKLIENKFLSLKNMGLVFPTIMTEFRAIIDDVLSIFSVKKGVHDLQGKKAPRVGLLIMG